MYIRVSYEHVKHMDFGSIQISKVISMAKDNDNVQNMTIAFVGSGINTQHQELKRAPLQSLRVRIQANRHASIDNHCSHTSSTDTNLAIEFHKHHPQSKILSIQVHPEENEGEKKDISFPNISAECIIAGIEVATLAGAQIIYLSVRTTSAKDIILLRECCSKVSQQGRLILTSEHGDTSRLRDFGDIYTISSKPVPIVSSFLSPQDYSLQNIFYAHPKLFSSSPLRGQIFSLTNKELQESKNNNEERDMFFQYTAQVLALLQKKIEDRITIIHQREKENTEEIVNELEKSETDTTRIDKLYEKLLVNGMFYIPLPLIDERLEL